MDSQWTIFLHDPMSWFALFTLAVLALVGLAVIRLRREVGELTHALRAERRSHDLARYSNQDLRDLIARRYLTHPMDPLPFTDEDQSFI